MPFPKEHSSRQNDPDKYIRIRRENDKFGSGIDVIWGVKSDGSVEVQAIRFDKNKYSPSEVKEWLKNHDYKTSIEQATEKKERYQRLFK